MWIMSSMIVTIIHPVTNILIIKNSSTVQLRYGCAFSGVVSDIIIIQVIATHWSLAVH
jgi:hypothetical protein